MMQKLRRALPLVTLAIVLVICFATAIFLMDRRLVASNKPIIDERVSTARASASMAASWFSSYKESAEKIAKTLEPWNGTPSQSLAARAKLDASLRDNPVFDRGALILTNTLSVVAASTSRAGEVGVPRRFPYAEQSARGRVTISDLFEDPVDKAPQFGTAVPLKDGTRVTGIFLPFSSIQPLIDLAKRLDIHRPETYLVTPQNGEISIAAPPTLVQRSTRETQEPADEARAGARAGFHQYLGEGGVPKSTAYAPIEGTDGWALLLVEDTASFLPFESRPLARLTAPGPIRTGAISLALIAVGLIAGAGLLMRRLRAAQVQADRTKRAFLAVTGHELRTPLTSIRGFAQLLQSRWERMTDEQRAEMITTIARQARNLEHLVERLLIGAQIEAGLEPGANIRTIDLASVTDQVAAHYESLNPLHSFDVDVERPLIAQVDQKLAEQVLNHVVENALKYSPDGGTVWIKGRRNGRWVEVVVDDEGVGLPSDATRIFERFAQGEDVDTRTYDEGGVGLGLFIAKHHLTQMGGRIRAERREPKGARLVIEVKPGE
jgi:signal transduction histidine kinase